MHKAWGFRGLGFRILEARYKGLGLGFRILWGILKEVQRVYGSEGTL